VKVAVDVDLHHFRLWPSGWF